jgi:Ca-activated chloride channel family protein
MSLSLPHRLSLWASTFLALGIAAGCASRTPPPEAESAKKPEAAALMRRPLSKPPAEPPAVVSLSREQLPPPEAAEEQPAAEEPGEVEGGVEGGVVGGVVGGVLGGVLGATVGGSSGEKVLPFGAAPSSMPELKPQAPSGNSFEAHTPNAFTDTRADPLSTFAVDVDTASYSLARRYLKQGNLPPPESVRVEEFVNYFKYRYSAPEKESFSVNLEGAPSPFDKGRHFLRVGIQGKQVSRSQRKRAHLVFLVDTSGSMQPPDKLPLAKEAMKIAVKNLNENDTVAIVTYAGSTQDVLPPTPATEQERIYAAIDSLRSGGGTAMGSGMELAYRHALKRASGNAVSRVIVLTDGDTNIGPHLSAESMLESVRGSVSEGVTLTAVGFGMGNYRDGMMEKLADKGNGNCFYVDNYPEARKVFETQLTGTLEVIAKDVKLQVEFNPAAVRRYRLVGYENRDVADRDFRNDKVDAGEIGAGHNVTALYEVELTGEQQTLATVRIRAKAPDGAEAAEQAFPFERSRVRSSLESASPDFRFALAVASTADILRHSPSAQGWSLATARKLAERTAEGQAERAEFVKLVTQAQALMGSMASHER